MKTRRFIAELKQRGVYRAAALYAAAAWGLLQVADVLFPVIGLPDWSIKAVLLLGAVGFPVVLVLAWMFDLTPGGLVDASATNADLPLPRLSPVRMLELLLILTLALLVGQLYYERLAPASTQPALAVPPEDVSQASIAVLPFVNLSGAEEVEYFGDGLAEEILNLLAQLDELSVAARTSSFYYKGKNVDVPTMGRQLGVAHVLEGSVRHQGDRIRVTAQLIAVDRGYHLWSKTYDRDLDDIFTLQDDIAGQVVSSLEVLLSSESRRVLDRELNIDTRAYDFYLQGRAYLRRPLSPNDLGVAVQMFARALDMAPDFAGAHAGLCDAELALYRITRSADEYNRAEAACQRALALDTAAAPVHVALGNLYRESGEYGDSLAQFDRALALDTDAVAAWLGKAETFAREGRDRPAEEAYRRAIALQPNYWSAYTGMGNFLFSRGRAAEAIPYYERICDLMPDSATALNDLGAAYYITGNFEAAVAAFEQSLAVEPTAVAYSNLAANLYFLRKFDESVEMYHRAVEQSPDDYELWGGLADAYSHTPDQKDLAAPMYRNAARLAARQLAVNPSNADTLAALGHYHAGLGERERALDYTRQAVDVAPGDMYVHYFAALTLSQLGMEANAIDALQRALDSGYPAGLIAVDAGFDSLAGSELFRSLLPVADAEPTTDE